MSSESTTDTADDHAVQPIRVGSGRAEEGGWQWQKFLTFQPASQAEVMQRRQWGAFGSKTVENVRRGLQNCQAYQDSVVALMDKLLQVSQMRTFIMLESNIRSELVSDAPLDPDVVDQLELENLIALDRHISYACRYFGIRVDPPAQHVTAVMIRKRIDENIDMLLECLKQVDPIWANKMNDCARDIQVAHAIEKLLTDVGNSHRACTRSKEKLNKTRDMFFRNVDALEKTIHWVYNAEQAALKRRKMETPTKKEGKDAVQELQTQLRWLYQAAIDLARERRRFVELCQMHMDIVTEVRHQRYDSDNVVVRYKKRPSYTGTLSDLASQLFSVFWDEQVERVTQMHVVSEEVKRLIEAWKKDNKMCAALTAECNELSRLPDSRERVVEELRVFLENNRQVGRDFTACLETVVPEMRRTTERLKERGADRERAKVEAMKKGAAAAFDPALDDPVLQEIERKETYLEEAMIRCQEAKVNRAEALENLQHNLCHREKERERMERNCAELTMELNQIVEEIASVEEENRAIQARFKKQESPKKKALQAADLALLQEMEVLELEVNRKKRQANNLQTQKTNTKLKIQCLQRQKKILETACEEKEKTIKEFQRHMADSKSAVADRRRFRSIDDMLKPAVSAAQCKIDCLREHIAEFKKSLETLLKDVETSLKKHGEVSSANLKRMDAHRAWCLKNTLKEMELQWNKMQLRKMLCEANVRTTTHTCTTIVEHDCHTGYRSAPHSPVILYHELSTPVRKNMERMRMPPTERLEAMQSPSAGKSGSESYSTRHSESYERHVGDGGLKTPAAAYSPTPKGSPPCCSAQHSHSDKKVYTFTETKSFSRRFTAKHLNTLGGRLQWKTELDTSGQPVLTGPPRPPDDQPGGPSGQAEQPANSDTTIISIRTEQGKDLNIDQKSTVGKKEETAQTAGDKERKQDGDRPGPSDAPRQ